jgi:predicted dehydrogenase
MKSKLGLGLLGTGVAANELYLPAFRKLGDKIALVACANRTRKKAERFARLAGIPTVVEDADALFALPEVEAVLISLPIGDQPALVLSALAAGKAVLSEKPIAADAAAGARLVKAAKRFRRPWLVGENFGFMPHVVRLCEWLRAGRLGAVRTFQASQTTLMNAKNPYFGTPWRHEGGFFGGFVVDAGVHLAHVVRRCFGMPARIQSRTAHFDAAMPAPDTAVAILEFESGVVGTWTSCFSARSSAPMLRVCGNKAEVELGYSHVTIRDAKGKETRFESPVDSFQVEFEHFADVVKAGKRPALTPEDALDDLRLIETIVRARQS